MKKVLFTLLAVLMAVPSFAINVYNQDDTKVDIYGTVRGFLGYGHGMSDQNIVKGQNVSSSNDNFIYGLQGNSRLGFKFLASGFSGQVEIGLNEKTLRTQSTNDTVGVRQIWGAYSFGEAGQILVGKTDTPTSMSGFSSDIFFTDGGLDGFGGNNTGSRRFQVQYNIAGLSLALIEDDTDSNGPLGTLKRSYIPRVALAYTFKSSALLAKLGASYTAINGDVTINKAVEWKTIHAFDIVAGVKANLLNNNLWAALQLGYDMNGDLFGERKTVAPNGTNGTVAISKLFGASLIPGSASVDQENGKIYNISRVNIAAEVGYKLLENMAVILGGGYQYTIYDALNIKGQSTDIHTYSIYLQAPYSVNKYLMFIPQLGYYATSGSYDNSIDKLTVDATESAVLLGMQMRVSF